MNRSSIAQSLERVEEFLQDNAIFLLPPETRKELLERAQNLLDKARCPGELLYVGILGGTGVGKSTLINALARKEISSSSDRRPFTDRAVVYRHREVSPALEKVQHLIRNPDAIHDAESVRDLVLLDLPDFDSQEQANRRTVLEILPALDSVVWVVSPEKYADAAFYRFVKQTAISQDNFTFVFNKADEVLGEDEAQRHQPLKELLGDLTFRLKHEAGIEQPRIFNISASSELAGKPADGALRTEFRKLRDFLMGTKDAKEIASIKTKNLAEESARLLEELNRQVRPEETARVIRSAREHSARGRARASGQSMAILEEERKLAQGLFGFLIHADPSIGPVRTGMRLICLARACDPMSGAEGLETIFQDLTKKLWKERRADLERITDSAESELVLSLGHVEAFPSRKDPAALIGDARKYASAFLAQWLQDKEQDQSRASARLLRLLQKACLLGPVILLILKLLGPESVGNWLDDPSLLGAAGLTISCLTSLFGSQGLIGMAALVLCELVLVTYLSSRRLKKIDKLAREVVKVAVRHLCRRLDSAFQRVERERAETLQRIEEALERLESINAAVTPEPTWRNVEILPRTVESFPDNPAGRLDTNILTRE